MSAAALVCPHNPPTTETGVLIFNLEELVIFLPLKAAKEICVLNTSVS